MSSESPESTEFDEESIAEIAVDGRVVARLAEIDDLSKSPADEAAIIALLRRVLDDSAEEFEEEHGITPAEAVRKAEPDVQFGNEAQGWDPMPLDALTEDR
jgi:hypothetical protein